MLPFNASAAPMSASGTQHRQPVSSITRRWPTRIRIVGLTVFGEVARPKGPHFDSLNFSVIVNAGLLLPFKSLHPLRSVSIITISH
jgi:hypothetical protein